MLLKFNSFSLYPLLLCFSIFFISCSDDTPGTFVEPPPELLPGELEFLDGTIGNIIARINIEVADDDQERTMGLMNRIDLGANEGLLFIFDSSGIQIATFQNTLIPLDVLFVSEDSTIVKISENIPPNSPQLISSDQAILYALEVNGGYVSQIPIQVGDKINFVLP